MARRLSNKRVVEYSDYFKIMVVRLTQIEGIQSKQIGDCLDLHPLMISRWRKQLRDGQLVTSLVSDSLLAKKKEPLEQSEREELARLRKQNSKLKEEVDFLKKWQQYLKEQKQKDSGL